MKTQLLSLLGFIGISAASFGQCAVTSAPSNNCNYFSTQIAAFTLNNVASIGNSACGSGGYDFFPTPVRTMTMGNTYNWTATTGTGYYSVGFAIWIDLNDDGFYGSNEMLATSPPNSTHSGQITIPLSATPGTSRPMRLRSGWYTNITGGQACTNWLGGYGETEDYLVDIVSPPPCSGIPTSNTVVVTPSAGVCLGGSANLSLANSYTNYGYTYAWQSATLSNVGPWTAIPSATNSSFAAPSNTGTVYYQAVITCTNSSGTTTALAGQVFIQGTTVKQVPYIEDFEGITRNNEWPNCSWSATSPTTVSRTYTTTMSQQRSANSGSKFASFYYFPSGTNYVFTNGIKLYSGVTYSTGLWYKTNNYGDLNWTNMSIMLGQSQTSSGLVTLASTNGPAASVGYKSLTNTFTVPNTGVYYFAVKGVSSGNCCAYHLNWDDFSVTAPCSLNTPSISLTPNTATICSGGTVNILASGAHTFKWNTNETGNVIYVTPNSSTTYTVAGLDTITGCTSSQSQYIQVNNAPNVFIFTNKNSVCAGQPVNLSAVGAVSYTWSNLSNNQNIIVSPNSSGSYSVIGINNLGCTSQTSQFINVYPSPIVVANTDRGEICKGESATLSGSGASTYQWMANTLYISAPIAIVAPNVTTTYTLVGTDVNGCSNSTTIMQAVMDCVGLNGITTTQAGIKLYPNPSTGVFTMELGNTTLKNIEVTDVTGRVIHSAPTADLFLKVDLNAFSNGIYYVKIQSKDFTEVIKVVKH